MKRKKTPTHTHGNGIAFSRLVAFARKHGANKKQPAEFIAPGQQLPLDTISLYYPGNCFYELMFFALMRGEEKGRDKGAGGPRG